MGGGPSLSTNARPLQVQSVARSAGASRPQLRSLSLPADSPPSRSHVLLSIKGRVHQREFSQCTSCASLKVVVRLNCHKGVSGFGKGGKSQEAVGHPRAVSLQQGIRYLIEQHSLFFHTTAIFFFCSLSRSKRQVPWGRSYSASW